MHIITWSMFLCTIKFSEIYEMPPYPLELGSISIYMLHYHEHDDDKYKDEDKSREREAFHLHNKSSGFQILKSKSKSSRIVKTLDLKSICQTVILGSIVRFSTPPPVMRKS